MTELPQSVSLPAAAALPHPGLHGQVVIITGGAGGLGSAIGRVLGEAGARLIMADLTAKRAEAAAAAINDHVGGPAAVAQGVALDVGDEVQVKRLIADVRERHGRLDVLINTAAIDITAPISELEGSAWERIVRTNLTGSFLMAKHAAAAMGPRTAGGGGGAIVNIASTASKRAWPNASAYHATKWGLLGLSHALHAELRPIGIKVCAIVAGGMRTPFLLDRFPDIDPDLLQDPLNVAQAVRFVLMQPAETVIPEITVLPMRETSWP